MCRLPTLDAEGIDDDAGAWAQVKKFLIQFAQIVGEKKKVIITKN